jgi:hypothetical protein
LSEGFGAEPNRINIRKYENEGSLIIIDSIKGHFGSDDLTTFVKQLVKKAEGSGKKSVSMFADGGSFFHFKKLQEIVEHEMSMPSKFDMNLKRFCVLDRKDFDILEEEETKVSKAPWQRINSSQVRIDTRTDTANMLSITLCSCCPYHRQYGIEHTAPSPYNITISNLLKIVDMFDMLS